MLNFVNINNSNVYHFHGQELLLELAGKAL